MRPPSLAALAALVALAAPGRAASAGPSAAQGDHIVNVASVTSSEHAGGVTSGAATITVRIPVPATIELLAHSPGASAARPEPVERGAYRTGPADSDPFAPAALPRPAGSPGPLDLSRTLPLAPVALYHQGDPVFIRVADLDRNLDRLARETLLVSVTDDLTGDVEVVRLTEDGPDTGVFVGYAQTAGVASAPGPPTGTRYDGVLLVVAQSRVAARYVDPMDGTDTVAISALVDPMGLVFDSHSGLPVSGAAVTVVDAATGQPAAVLSDDGLTPYPATVISGQPVTDGAGRVQVPAAGQFRFPFLRPGTYRFQVRPPAGYAAPSTAADADLRALPGAPFAVVPGSRGEPFPLEVGPAVHLDIPIDPGAGDLWVQKTAAKDRVGVGDFLAYQIAVTNRATAAAAGVQVVDALPVGFRYQRGSARWNDAAAPDPALSDDGRSLTFQVGTLEPSTTGTLHLAAQVGAGAAVGSVATNQAWARGASGTVSNVGLAAVKVTDDFLSTRSLIIGRVTAGADACPDDAGLEAGWDRGAGGQGRVGGEDRGAAGGEGTGRAGVEGVRVFLEDGAFVVSDKRGLFHLEGVRPGLHVVQLDPDSLPAGFEAVLCTRNDRFAGRATSQFVEVQGGALWRADFHLRARATAPPPAPALLTGEPAGGSQQGAPPGGPAEASPTGASLPPPRTELTVERSQHVAGPAGASTGAGEASPTGASLPPPRTELTVERSQHVAGPAGASKAAGEASHLQAPSAGNGLQPDERQAGAPARLLLRFHFPPCGSALTGQERTILDEVACSLRQAQPGQIAVTGYTDSLPIVPRARTPYRDNAALSLARARSVYDYLMGPLQLSADRVVMGGKGELDPVASNEHEPGRALNRRVEVVVEGARQCRATLEPVRAIGAEAREAPGAAPAPSAGVARPEQDGPAPASSPAAPATGAEPSAALPSVAEPAAPGAALAPSSAVAAGAASAAPTGAAAVPAADGAGAVARAAPAPAPPPPADGILSPSDGELIADRINAVQVQVPSELSLTLLVDGKPVDATRIGYRRVDPATGKTTATYVGVDLGEKGQHTLTLEARDPFGNVRLRREAALTRTGEIASIRLVSAEGNVADARTPVRIRLELLDATGDVIHASTRLELKEGNLQPLRREGENLTLDDAAAARRVSVDRDGWVLFEPVNASGSYRAVVGLGAMSLEAETWVVPRLRDWILVGLAEGTVGYDLATGNLESLRGGEAHEELYGDGRLAFYAKGRILGKWLLTMAYDSARPPSQVGNGLFQSIDPQAYYTLYGDAGQQAHDAASVRKVYLKIEREQFYALFGDLDTGLTVTELSRYSRKLNGFKTELQTRHLEVNAFGAQTDQVYARDEIPGDGTSGLYHLSHRGLAASSETVTIVARDRFRSEVVVSTRVLARFVDYSVDYDSGTLFFREPIPSRDPLLNPVTIVVEYESPSPSGQDYTAGGRAGLKLPGPGLRAGVTVIHDGQGERRSDLYGADARWDLSRETKLRGELAFTDSRGAGTSGTGSSFLVEAAHASRAFDAKLYLREQEGAFGLGQQSTTEAGTRKLGFEGAYRLGDRLAATAQAYRQEAFTAGTERLLAEARLNYLAGPHGAYLGLLDATDRLADGTHHGSGQLTLGGKLQTLGERLTLGLDYAQSVWGNGNAAFPTRLALRGELKLSAEVALLAAEELTWGAGARTQNTRVGLRSTPWKGGALTSSLDRRVSENGDRLFGNLGLRQTWQLSDEWKVDFGGERSQAIRQAADYTANPNVPPPSGTTVSPPPGSSEAFTALSAGATYQVRSFLWNGRAEVRTAASETKWTLLSGIVSELASGWAWSGRGQLLASSTPGGASSTSLNLRAGLVHRPPRTSWILLDRLDWYLDRRSGTASDLDSERLVNNLIANWRPVRSVQVSLGYGAKLARERIAGDLLQGYTDQVSAEGRLDVAEAWDVGLRSSVLHTWRGGEVAYSGGPSVGFSPAQNVWLGLGFNLAGYSDRDFSAASYTASGPYLRMRMKLDQDSVRDAAAWLNKL